MRALWMGTLLLALLPANAQGDRSEELMRQVLERLERLEHRLDRLERRGPMAMPRPPMARPHDRDMRFHGPRDRRPDHSIEPLLDAARRGDPHARAQLMRIRHAIDEVLGRDPDARAGEARAHVDRARDHAAELHRRIEELTAATEAMRVRLAELHAKKKALQEEKKEEEGKRAKEEKDPDGS